MEFTVLSHAGLCASHNGVRIVSDPWLIGSCYWRSWWNFPEPPREQLVNALNPDYIYLTHLHWDHFHGASLKKLFSPDTPIIVPKVHTRRMIDDLRWLGFRNVIEIPHGSSIRLGEDFTLTSYQFNLLGSDSAQVLSGGGCTILNSNDCKHFGLPLRQITRAFPNIDFVLRSHSSATPIPYCIEGYRDLFPSMRSQRDYIEEFSRFALHVGARYAIPFASNHCFLHRETIHFNHTAVLPSDVQSYYRGLAARAGIRSDCIVMSPGSRWSDTAGFELVEADTSTREQQILSMVQRHGATLASQYAKEEVEVADFDAFRNYFLGMIGSIPWLIRQWMKTRWLFRTADVRGPHLWAVDMAAGTVEELSPIAQRTDGAQDIEIEVPALILNDCARNRMFSVWPPSKRLRIRMASRQRLRSVIIFLQLLDMYELDVLPIRKNFSWRAVVVRVRRWREIIEMGRMVFRHLVLHRPIDIAALYALPVKQAE